MYYVKREKSLCVVFGSKEVCILLSFLKESHRKPSARIDQENTFDPYSPLSPSSQVLCTLISLQVLCELSNPGTTVLMLAPCQLLTALSSVVNNEDSLSPVQVPVATAIPGISHGFREIWSERR